jgi:hypothetical protein
VKAVRVTWDSAALWCLYKIPFYARKLTGHRELSDQELSPTHQRAAKRILALTLDLRGIMIKTSRLASGMSRSMAGWICPANFPARLNNA